VGLRNAMGKSHNFQFYFFHIVLLLLKVSKLSS
jgi:hypothetical protein